MKFRARISRWKKEVMLPPNDNFNTMYVYVLHILRILSHPYGHMAYLKTSSRRLEED